MNENGRIVFMVVASWFVWTLFVISLYFISPILAWAGLWGYVIPPLIVLNERGAI